MRYLIRTINILAIAILPVGDTFAQQVAIEPYNPSRRDSLTLYTSYYNPVKIIAEKVPCNDMELIADGFSIIKGKNCEYFIKASQQYSNYINIIVHDTLYKKLPASIKNDIPLPGLHLHKEINGLGSSNYIFDSLFCIPYYHDGEIGHEQYKINMLNNTQLFKIVFYTIELVIDEKLIFVENVVNSNKYPKSFLSIIQQHLKPVRGIINFPVDVLYIKNVIVEDDLGNVYRLPDYSLPLRGY